MATVQCPQCMFDNPEGAASCEQCGSELAPEALSMMLGEVCRSCDSYNDPGVRICVSCGSPLGAVAEAVSEPPPPVLAEVAAKIEAAAVAEAPKAAAAPAKSSAPLPPGALPPGWAAYQQSAPPAKPAAPPAGSLACDSCNAENAPGARFCGNCGHPLAVAAAPKAKGKLILIRGIAGEGRQFQLSQGNNAVGRTEGVASFPDDPYISPHHATFGFKGDDLFVKDEGASNGVFFRLKEAQSLRPGDMFVVGERLLRFLGAQPVGVLNAGRHGSPRTTDRLVVLEELLEGGGVGRICKRAGPIVTIGRAGCDLNFPSDGFVSARHAELSMAGETAFLRDLGSANGTFLRVAPKAERKLSHGDYLLMGRELLRVELSAHR